jgi:hypothetical protein
MFKKLLLTTMIVSSLLLAESGVGLNINEQDLELEGILDSRNLEALQTSSTIFQADVNFLKNNEETTLIGAGLGATNKLEGVEGVEVTLGAKFIWAEIAEENFTALPFMAKVRYSFPPLMFNIPPIAIEGKILYAPKVLSFGDSVSYNEFRVSADMELIESVRIYVGYRNIHTQYVGIKPDLFNTSFYAGMKFSY